MARKIREKSGTGIYHVMLRGINRQDIFNDEEDYRRFLTVLSHMVCPSDETTGKPLPPRCLFYAYCLMPNHVHLLIRENTDCLSEAVKRIAVAYAQYYNKKYERFGHLFQDRFRSEPVNDGSYFFTLLQYIHQNPVAAGLSADVDSYPWNSWGEYVRHATGIQTICCTQHVLARMPLEELHDFVNTLLPATDSMLDFDSGVEKNSDEEVRRFLKDTCGLRTPQDIQLYPRERQLDIVRLVRDYGASLRQISRLTGLSYGIVRRA